MESGRRDDRDAARILKMPANSAFNLTPPPIIEQIPKSALRYLDASDVVRAQSLVNLKLECIDLMFHHLQSLATVASLQQRRIERAKRGPGPVRGRQLGMRLIQLFAETEFYLICWTRIQNIGRKLKEITQSARVNAVLSHFDHELNARRRMRNHLEHFEERLHEPQRYLKHDLRDLKNMAGEFLTIGGEKVDVGAQSRELLIEIVNAIKTAVLYDALDELSKPGNFPHLKRLVLSAAREAERRRLLRREKYIFDS